MRGPFKNTFEPPRHRSPRRFPRVCAAVARERRGRALETGSAGAAGPLGPSVPVEGVRCLTPAGEPLFVEAVAIALPADAARELATDLGARSGRVVTFAPTVPGAVPTAVARSDGPPGDESSPLPQRPVGLKSTYAVTATRRRIAPSVLMTWAARL